MLDAAWESVPQCRCYPVKLPLTECRLKAQQSLYLYVVLTMSTLNKAYLFIYLFNVFVCILGFDSSTGACVEAKICSLHSEHIFDSTQASVIAAWNFQSEVILLEHELLTIPGNKQEHAPSEL